MAWYNDPRAVAEQYRDGENLSKRVKLHQKHSTSPVPFADWCFSQYAFEENDRILELGCGTGAQWQGRIGGLPSGSVLVLTDLFAGMAETVWRAYGDFPRVLAHRADIRSLPYPAETFDRVIANHMLYHVPDIPAALAEVRRVLRPDGVFYCTTMGAGGMRGYLHDALRRFDPALDAFGDTLSFTLQNGEKLLRAVFADVRRIDFEDSLHVTDTRDLMDWIESSPSVQGLAPGSIEGLYDYFEAIRTREGAIDIPKEAGMFVSRGSAAAG
jgi:ubiquinone/menaquinone biosynthesis C-methylase UbiE